VMCLPFTILLVCGPIPYFRNVKFVRVCSLVGRYFYNMYIVKKFKIVFSFNVNNNNIFPCLRDIRLS